MGKWPRAASDLVPHLKRRRILRLRFSVIIDACCADIRVPEPLLNFRNIRAGELPRHQFLSPGNEVRARDDPKFPGPPDAGEAHEFPNRLLVHPPCAGAVDIRKPFRFGRNVFELLEFLRRQ